jgi:hypothetical protein
VFMRQYDRVKLDVEIGVAFANEKLDFAHRATGIDMPAVCAMGASGWYIATSDRFLEERFGADGLPVRLRDQG